MILAGGPEMAPLTPPVHGEEVPGLAAFGARAITTTRLFGSLALQSPERAADIHARWQALAAFLSPSEERIASAHQVHGSTVLVHGEGWRGWLRASDADGHVALTPGTAMVVSVADCVPVFLVHPGGAAAILHSGWRGTEVRIASRAVRVLADAGFPARELAAHCGPAICGSCYEVSPEVLRRLTGRAVDAPAPVDLRALIADDLRKAGVREVTISPWCTRCHNSRFFSHRAGDIGRQVGAICLHR